MTPKAKSTALVLSGAVALSFTAYAIGSQTGSGNAGAQSASAKSVIVLDRHAPGLAGAASAARGGRPSRCGPALDDLAAKLGVSTSALQKAFEEARQSLPRPADRRDEHLEELADALGVTEAKLRAAIGTVKPDRGERHDELAAALAKELGVSAAKVRDAFEKLHDQGRPGPGDREDRKADLAKALGVSEAKLEQAFQNLRGDFRGKREERKDDRGADLAKALGISQAKVDAAFEKLRAAHEAEHQKMRDALAASLAKSLNLDEAKVKAALDDFAPERGGHPPPLVSPSSSSSTTRRRSGRPSSARCASRASPWPRPPGAERRSRRSLSARRLSSSWT